MYYGEISVREFVLAGKAASIDAQIQDRLSKDFRDLEIITFRNEFDRDFDNRLKILSKYKDLLNYVSVHAPGDLTIAHVDESQREFAQHCIEKIIRVAPKINCERVVIHGSYYVTGITNQIMIASLRKKVYLKCVERIKHLAKTANGLGVKICLENVNARLCLDQLYVMIFGASPYDLVKTANAASSANFKFCFDAAHAYNFCRQIHESQEMQTLYGIKGFSITDFFGIISENVDIIHFSDAKGSIAGLKENEHLPLRKGKIDFKALLEVIVKSTFSGPIVIETQPQSMVNDRKYLNTLLNLIMRIA